MSEGVTPELGIFARIFRRHSADAVAAAVQAAGFRTVQLNLNSLGLPTIPAQAELAEIDFTEIGSAFADRGITIWGVSATFNTIDPNRAARLAASTAAAELIARIPLLGSSFATICTGTRDPGDMWRAHPRNADPDAWRDLRETLDVLLPAAEAAGVRLGIEPEAANVVADAGLARRLIDELGASGDLVGIVLDPANLVSAENAGRQDVILRDAFETLASHIVCIHAKDVATAGFAAAGSGLLDYPLILRLRANLPDEVPLIVQDVSEDDAPGVRRFLQDELLRNPWHGAAQR
jgi:sugar phosphate isomerase/epimerase